MVDKKKPIKQSDDGTLEEDLADEETEEDLEEDDEDEIISRPSKRDNASQKMSANEDPDSMCITCGHQNICHKRKQILDAHSKIKESMSLTTKSGFTNFNFRAGVDICDDFIPQISKDQDDNGRTSYAFNLSSNKVTIEKRGKKK